MFLPAAAAAAAAAALSLPSWGLGINQLGCTQSWRACLLLLCKYYTWYVRILTNSGRKKKTRQKQDLDLHLGCFMCFVAVVHTWYAQGIHYACRLKLQQLSI